VFYEVTTAKRKASLQTARKVLHTNGVCDDAVVWGTGLQAGRSGFRFLMEALWSRNWLIL